MQHILILFPQCRIVSTLFHSLSLLILGRLQCMMSSLIRTKTPSSISLVFYFAAWSVMAKGCTSKSEAFFLARVYFNSSSVLASHLCSIYMIYYSSIKLKTNISYMQLDDNLDNQYAVNKGEEDITVWKQCHSLALMMLIDRVHESEFAGINLLIF